MSIALQAFQLKEHQNTQDGIEDIEKIVMHANEQSCREQLKSVLLPSCCPPLNQHVYASFHILARTLLLLCLPAFAFLPPITLSDLPSVFVVLSNLRQGSLGKLLRDGYWYSLRPCRNGVLRTS